MEILDTIAKLNTIWNGTRYVIVSATTNPSFASKNLSLASVGICEIDFPKCNILLHKQKGLSSKTIDIPIGVEFGNMVLRGATTRDNGLWERLSRVKKLVEGNGTKWDEWQGVLENIIIAEYSTTGLQNSLPIAMYVAENCFAISYTPAKARANGNEVPLDELVMSVGNFYRV